MCTRDPQGHIGRNRGFAEGIQETAHHPYDAEDAGWLLCEEVVFPVSDLSADRQIQVRLEDEHGQPWLFHGTCSHGADCGQVSINISRPGITKGQHWHNSKWELFIVVAGHGLIQERNINTDETVEFEVSGDKIEAVHMIPGWTHNIINLSETENLVTVMTCNEIFDPKHPDTFFEPV